MFRSAHIEGRASFRKRRDGPQRASVDGSVLLAQTELVGVTIHDQFRCNRAATHFYRGRPGERGASHRGPCPLRRLARAVLARRLQVGHAGHQGDRARRMGRRAESRLCPVRLFRPRRIRRRFRRRYHRALAGRERRGVRAVLRRTPSGHRLIDGRLDGAAAGARIGQAAGHACVAGWAGADRAGARFHRGADVEGIFAGKPGRRSRPGACGCALPNMANPIRSPVA